MYTVQWAVFTVQCTVGRVAEKQHQTIQKTAGGKLTSGFVAGGLIVRLLGRELQTRGCRIGLATRYWRKLTSKEVYWVWEIISSPINDIPLCERKRKKRENKYLYISIFLN